MRGKFGALGIRFDSWNQALFLSKLTLEDLAEGHLTPSNELRKRKWGAALSFRACLKVKEQTALFLELGAKSAGYLPGYSLGKGGVMRVGMQFGLKQL